MNGTWLDASLDCTDGFQSTSPPDVVIYFSSKALISLPLVEASPRVYPELQHDPCSGRTQFNADCLGPPYSADLTTSHSGNLSFLLYCTISLQLSRLFLP